MRSAATPLAGPRRQLPVRMSWPLAQSRRPRQRSGLTLLEVLISTAVFLGALTAIMQVFRLGTDAELLAQLDSEAVLRAESLMAELISGATALENVSDQQFADGAVPWTYSVLVEPESEGLLRVTVTVNHTRSSGMLNSSYQLIRLIRDPQLFLDAALSGSGSE